MSSEKKIILVVDDTPENILLLSELLKADYKIKAANSGNKALMIANKLPHPDLILLDIVMPEMDGYDVCRQLKENPATSKIPVIFITAKNQNEDEKKGLELGAVDYIVKPVNPSIVKARISTHLALYDLNRDLEHKVKERTNELRKTQARLIQAEKMEYVGRLAAGIAHEVKNPLAIIQMGFYYLFNETQLDETSSEVVNDINDAIQRADTVIKGLLDFSHDRELELKPSNLNEVILRSLHLVEYEMRQRKIKIASNLADDLPITLLDANKLQQVLINLFMNSAQAMKRDGNLHIVSCLKTLDSREMLDYDHENNFMIGEHVLWLEVTDTGSGIREEDRHKIFEPFYTTKPVGEGTGLGMSVSRNIMNLHHGSIDIRNQKEGGASVVLIFKLREMEKNEEENFSCR